MKISIGLTLTASLLATTALAQDKTVTIASWGGSYQEAQTKALFEPAAKATGIIVKEETYGGMSDVRLQVTSGAVSFDIVASGSGSAARAGAEGLLEELDYSVIDVTTFYPALYSKHCVGGDVFSTVYAWNTNTYGDAGPQSWADFWDVEKFPGSRAYRGKVAGALAEYGYNSMRLNDDWQGADFIAIKNNEMLKIQLIIIQKKQQQQNNHHLWNHQRQSQI